MVSRNACQIPITCSYHDGLCKLIFMHIILWRGNKTLWPGHTKRRLFQKRIHLKGTHPWVQKDKLLNSKWNSNKNKLLIWIKWLCWLYISKERSQYWLKNIQIEISSNKTSPICTYNKLGWDMLWCKKEWLWSGNIMVQKMCITLAIIL